ncbi:hypothetical protein [Sphingomonas sanguinis]|jgi:hypothetical protein|nr:hypothetical protein [Sphingomonas sanguinis]
MSSHATTKTPSGAQTETSQPEAPARPRPKLSLHYGAKPPEARK